MGHKQSSQKPSAASPLAAGSLAPFHHPVILQGLAGSGKRSVQQLLQIPASRTLQIADTFLTSPPIYGMYWGSNNHPDYSDPQDEGMWDYGGRGGIQPVWSLIANSTKAVVFVVDASDRASLIAGPDAPAPLTDAFVKGYAKKTAEEQATILAELRSRMTAKQLFTSLYATGRMEGRPLLVLANKQDQPGAMPPAELAELLGLPQLEDMDWRISGCNAQTGEGLAEAFDWLNYIIANPTNFLPMRQLKWKADSAIYSIAASIQKASTTLRDDRLAAGWILAAPLPYPKRKDGSTWSASPEQLLTMVLPQLTPDPEQEEHDRLVETSRQTEETIQLTKKLMESIHEEDEDAFVVAVTAADVDAATASTSTPLSEDAAREPSAAQSSAADAQRDPEVSSNARTAETSIHSSTGRDSIGGGAELHNETLIVETVAPMDSKLKSFPASAAAPAAAPFSSLSSSFIVLPPFGSTTTLTRREVWVKKHWFSRRETRTYTTALVQDIHKKNRWGQYGEDQ